MAIAKSTNIAATTVQPVLEHRCDGHAKPFIEVVDDFVSLSLMSQEVHRDSTTTTVKWQRSDIFQFECKIKDNVCKLIIDGGSFANAISSYVVHALSLFTWRLPTPCYIQCMNTSGTLKITHKARVKFSVGDYVDSIDGDVAPMSAGHLLLGRPWQFDRDATHEGHSNQYCFAHKGVWHVLKSMLESTIRAEYLLVIQNLGQLCFNGTRMT
jgi:hypothetical protein